MNKRLVPYVEDRTLETVISRLQEKEHDYLKHITNKIRRENAILLPSEEPELIIPRPFASYELFSLSIPQGKKLPNVEFETIDEVVRVNIFTNEGSNFDSLVMEHQVDFRDNPNLERFVSWLDYKKTCPSNLYRVSVIYSLLKKQAEKDEMRRIASLN